MLHKNSTETYALPRKLKREEIEDYDFNIRVKLGPHQDEKRVHKICLMEKGRGDSYHEIGLLLGKMVSRWHLGMHRHEHNYPSEKLCIHGGGMDLKFPHHECERLPKAEASNRACAGKNTGSRQHALPLNGKKWPNVLQGTITYPRNRFAERITP